MITILTIQIIHYVIPVVLIVKLYTKDEHSQSKMTNCDKKIKLISCHAFPQNNEKSRNRNPNRNCNANDIKTPSFHDDDISIGLSLRQHFDAFQLILYNCNLLEFKVGYFVHNQRCFYNTGIR